MTRMDTKNEHEPQVASSFSAREYDARPEFETRLRVAGKRRAKRAVQWIVRLGLAVVGMASSLRVVPRSPLRAGDPRIRRILVIRTDLIGDLVLSLPALAAMRRAYPDAEIDVVALPSTADLLAADPCVTRVITYDQNVWRRPVSLFVPRNWRQARELVATLRARDYDLCLSLAGDWASVLAWFSGARRRVGYAGEAYPGLLTDPVPGGRYHTRQHEIRYIRELARAAGGLIDDGELPHLTVHAPAMVSLAETLNRAGVPASRPLIALHPGARNGKAKRWPAEHWGELASLLAERLGATVVLVGASGERDVARRIAATSAALVFDLTGKTSLTELVALLARCDLVISGDSGPMHIAGAVKAPVIGLFGPTDPRISGPLAADALVMRREIWCGPCYDASATADCRFHNPVCMKSISARSVFAAAQRQLARSKPHVVPNDEPPEEEPFIASSRHKRFPST